MLSGHGPATQTAPAFLNRVLDILSPVQSVGVENSMQGERSGHWKRTSVKCRSTEPARILPSSSDMLGRIADHKINRRDELPIGCV